MKKRSNFLKLFMILITLFIEKGSLLDFPLPREPSVNYENLLLGISVIARDFGGPVWTNKDPDTRVGTNLKSKPARPMSAMYCDSFVIRNPDFVVTGDIGTQSNPDNAHASSCTVARTAGCVVTPFSCRSD